MNFNDFYNVLLEANPAKRMDYLRNKYAKALIELLTKYIDIKNLPTEEDVADWFYNTFGVDFVQYVVDRMDPQKGVYSEWIIKSLLKENFNSTTFDRFLTEDFYKVYEDLEKYHKYKKLFKTLGEELNNPNTVKLGDINQIKSFDDLYEKLRLLQPYIAAEEEKAELKATEKDVDKIYNSDNYLILTPKTQEASCAYGRNTRWCTASTGSYNYFNQYNRQGPLYIIINKNFNNKYQFHFQSEQYMDEDDDPIVMSSFLRNNPEISEIIIDLALKNGNLKLVRENVNSEKIIEKLETADESLKIKIIKDDFVIAYHIGLKEPELVNSNQKVLKFVESDKVELDSGVKTFSSIFNYVMDEDDAWRSENILDRDPDWFRDGHIKYDDEYWDWLDESNFELVKKYCKNQYPISFKELGNSEDLTIDEVKQFLEDKDDSHVNDALTYSYRLIYNDAVRNSIEEDIYEKVYEKLSSEFYYNDQKYIIFKIPHYKMNSIIKDFENYPEHIPPTDKNYFLSNYSEVLKEDNDLASPDFYPDPDVRSDDEQQYTAFNSYFRDSFYVGEDQRNKNQLQFDLSGVSRNMNKFDGYVFKVLKELNMAGPLTNQSGQSDTPQNVTQPNKTITSSQYSNTSTKPNISNKGKVQVAVDLDSVLNDPKMKGQWANWLKDPNNANALTTQYTTMTSDPKADKTKTDQFLKTIQSDQALSSFIANLGNNI